MVLFCLVYSLDNWKSPWKSSSQQNNQQKRPRQQEELFIRKPREKNTYSDPLEIQPATNIRPLLVVFVVIVVVVVVGMRQSVRSIALNFCS